MEIQYLLADPTKNITVLVTTPVSRALQPELASLLLIWSRRRSRWASWRQRRTDRCVCR